MPQVVALLLNLDINQEFKVGYHFGVCCYPLQSNRRCSHEFYPNESLPLECLVEEIEV